MADKGDIHRLTGVVNCRLLCAGEISILLY